MCPKDILRKPTIVKGVIFCWGLAILAVASIMIIEIIKAMV